MGAVIDRLVRAAKITAENDPEDRPSLDVMRALEHAVKTCSKDRLDQFVREAYGTTLLNHAVRRSGAWRRFVQDCVSRCVVNNTIVDASKNRVKDVLSEETIWIKELRKEEEGKEKIVVRDVSVVEDDVDPKLRDDALEAEVVRWDSDDSRNATRVVVRGVPCENSNSSRSENFITTTTAEVSDQRFVRLHERTRRISRNIIDDSSSKVEDKMMP